MILGLLVLAIGFGDYYVLLHQTEISQARAWMKANPELTPKQKLVTRQRQLREQQAERLRARAGKRAAGITRTRETGASTGEVGTERRRIKQKFLLKADRFYSKAILEGGAKPDHYLYKDAERMTKALDQVKYIAAGKEIPIPKAPPAAHLNQNSQLKTHQEAKEIFIKASGIVSQELKNNDKLVEADKLEDVAKFVSKIPYVGGKNKEHVKNALNAASNIISLKESGPVSDIKNAVSVLEKPERQQSMGNINKGLNLNRGGVER